MDRLTPGQAGQLPDVAIVVRDALPGQDRTPPYKGVRMSGVALARRPHVTASIESPSGEGKNEAPVRINCARNC
jgi:hypothetical protein